MHIDSILDSILHKARHYLGLGLWPPPQHRMGVVQRQKVVQKTDSFFQVINGLVPDYLSSLVPEVREQRYDLRNTHSFEAPKHRTDASKNSFFPHLLIFDTFWVVPNSRGRHIQEGNYQLRNECSLLLPRLGLLPLD